MKLALGLMALLVLSVPASAGCGRVALPPAAYDSGPLPGFEDVRVSYWKVDGICRAFGLYARFRIEGCWVDPHRRLTRAIRVTPQDLGDETFDACVRRHEDAHARGWGADHPDAYFD